MAEGEQGSWSWSSIIQAAKDKSAEVMEFVKRDLDEFSSAVKTEATSVVSSTATVLKDKLKLDDEESTAGSMKKSISTLFGQVSSALNPQPDDEDEEAILIQGSDQVAISPLQVQLYAIASDGATYLIDPLEDDELKPRFAAWLECQEDRGALNETRLNKLLGNNPHLKTSYEKLVPTEVTHDQFWQRFLFRKALLEDEEARNQAKLRRLQEEQRLKEEQEKINETVKKSMKKKPSVNQLDLTEEEQIRILSEYEQECNNPDELNLLPDHFSSPDIKPELLKTRDKKDMVIVGEGSSSSSNLTSLADRESNESNDGDWEKEFDLDDAEIDTEVNNTR